MEQANVLYKQGMEPSSLVDRQAAFNQALIIYLNEEKQHPDIQNGNLYKAIGNTFFQLKQYPEAILYYYRALRLHPRDEWVKSQLQLAQIQLDLPSSSEDSLLKKILSFNDFLPLPYRFEAFLWITFLTFFLFSLWLWSSYSMLKTVFYGFLFLTLLMLTNLALSYYFIPLEGILMSSTGLYREPDFHQSQVQSTPLRKGEKVTILSLKKDWLKIQYQDKLIGYIPLQTARMI